MRSDSYEVRIHGAVGLPFDIVVHPGLAPAVLVNVPGYGGHIDGYNRKYVTLAEDTLKRGIAATVRMPNMVYAPTPYQKTICDDVRIVSRYAREHADEITGTPGARLYLMGFSAGASAIAAVAADVGADAILLMAPSFDAADAAHEGIARFEGDVRVVVCHDDEVVGTRPGRIFFWQAEKARSRKLVTLMDCDHQFTGERNGYIVSKAPQWAFVGDKSFPSPEGGIKLY